MMTLQKIKAVLVEDEAAAREVLKNYLSKYCPQVEVIGEAQNIREAVPLLHQPHAAIGVFGCGNAVRKCLRCVGSL